VSTTIEYRTQEQQALRSRRVLARHGQPAVRRALPLSLTFDHRVVTGGEAARFLVGSRRAWNGSRSGRVLGSE
jgi:pyruvate/2-oxoglutarate dehydrogenase complex dihydrolipoamide acyltransferase (E2) component